MNRRAFLGLVGGSGFAAGSGMTVGIGYLSRFLGSGVDTEFELVDAEFAIDDAPAVTVDDESITVRGTVQYGSSSCGTVELAHSGFERSQNRLDLLVVAANDSWGVGGCTDDLVATGYRAEATTPGGLRRIAATEHHVFGETYSTTADLTDW